MGMKTWASPVSSQSHSSSWLINLKYAVDYSVCCGSRPCFSLAHIWSSLTLLMRFEWCSLSFATSPHCMGQRSWHLGHTSAIQHIPAPYLSCGSPKVAAIRTKYSLDCVWMGDMSLLWYFNVVSNCIHVTFVIPRQTWRAGKSGCVPQ